MRLSHFQGKTGPILVFDPDEGSEPRRHLPVERPVYSSA